MKRPPRLPFPGLAGVGAGVHRLPEGARHHLVTVLRAKPGAKVLVFDPDSGAEAAGVLVDTAGDVRLEAPHAAAAAAASDEGGRGAATDEPRVFWLHGLPKAKKADALVQDATELGVAEVHLFRAARSVVALDGDRAEKRTARLEAIARDAARQCGRADAPAVGVHDGLAEALAALPADARLFVLVPGAARALGPAIAEALADPGAPGAALAFLAGPEGGLTDAEVTRALAFPTGEGASRCAVAFGATVLRTETVPAAVLGALRALVALAAHLALAAHHPPAPAAALADAPAPLPNAPTPQ